MMKVSASLIEISPSTQYSCHVRDRQFLGAIRRGFPMGRGLGTPWYLVASLASRDRLPTSEKSAFRFVVRSSARRSHRRHINQRIGGEVNPNLFRFNGRNYCKVFPLFLGGAIRPRDAAPRRAA